MIAFLKSGRLTLPSFRHSDLTTRDINAVRSGEPSVATNIFIAQVRNIKIASGNMIAVRGI